MHINRFSQGYGNRDDFNAKCVRFRAQDGAAVSIQVRIALKPRNMYTSMYIYIWISISIYLYLYLYLYIYLSIYLSISRVNPTPNLSLKCARFRAQDGAAVSIQVR